jgi:hypothetical protein
LSPNYFAGFPGFYMSAREGLKPLIDTPGGTGFHMTVLGPVGLKARLINSFCFMGRMRTLRAIEYSVQDADLEE